MPEWREEMTSTLRQKLEQASSAPTRSCKMAEVLASLDSETSEYITTLLAVPTGTPRRISDSVMSQVLRSEGHNVGRSTINDHRRELCACYAEGI